ncbi:MAG: hypothetical protein J6S44_04780, partial [Clostridia bacterium]|nr:hypothetical protein [Clostridia bacterium]
ALVNIGFYSAGERVSAKFTVDERYCVQSITMQIGNSAPTPITLDGDAAYTFTMPEDTVTFHIETAKLTVAGREGEEVSEDE